MFTWFRDRKTNISRNAEVQIALLNAGIFPGFVDNLDKAFKALQKHIGDQQFTINCLQERVDELEKVQRTLCDDMYDIQADMTLIHNIEGYEEWRTDIGKPVKEPDKSIYVSPHPIDCGFHQDQYPWECTCGAYKPIAKPTDLVK
jgi:hypothetical protein